MFLLGQGRERVAAAIPPSQGAGTALVTARPRRKA
jgi:hypothetical protein